MKPTRFEREQRRRDWCPAPSTRASFALAKQDARCAAATVREGDVRRFVAVEVTHREARRDASSGVVDFRREGAVAAPEQHAHRVATVVRARVAAFGSAAHADEAGTASGAEPQPTATASTTQLAAIRERE